MPQGLILCFCLFSPFTCLKLSGLYRGLYLWAGLSLRSGFKFPILLMLQKSETDLAKLLQVLRREGRTRVQVDLTYRSALFALPCAAFSGQYHMFVVHRIRHCGFPAGSDSKESACNAGNRGLIPGSGRSPGEENGYPLQYTDLENSMDRGG